MHEDHLHAPLLALWQAERGRHHPRRPATHPDQAYFLQTTRAGLQREARQLAVQNAIRQAQDFADAADAGTPRIRQRLDANVQLRPHGAGAVANDMEWHRDQRADRAWRRPGRVVAAGVICGGVEPRSTSALRAVRRKSHNIHRNAPFERRETGWEASLACRAGRHPSPAGFRGTRAPAHRSNALGNVARGPWLATAGLATPGSGDAATDGICR